MVGAGFIGVEWATEIEHFFPDVKLTIIDFLPRCLGPLPDSAAEYCSEYMSACGIKEFYNCGYDPKNPDFWKKVELPNGADETYVCIGVKASNYFMPKSTLSDKGPGGGGWIHFNKHLQVTLKPSEGGGVWADGSIFAVGDCNYGCIGEPGKWEMPPVPKISYPGEEQAYHACLNVMRLAAWMSQEEHPQKPGKFQQSAPFTMKEIRAAGRCRSQVGASAAATDQTRGISSRWGRRGKRRSGGAEAGGGGGAA